MRLKLISMLAISAFAVSAAADEGFKISGDVATSVFVESGKGENNEFPGAGGAIGTGENNGDFSVDMVEINLEKSMGNTGVHLGIGYGRLFNGISNTVDANTVQPRATLNLTNAYIHHKVGDSGLTFKLGRFAANMGFESYNFMNNMNYTRSYAFQFNNPFFFTGVAADYAINEMVAIGAVVANATANSDFSENESKVMGVNATVTPMEGLTLKLNYLSGREGDTDNVDYVDTTRINASVMYTLNSMYDFALSYSSYDREDAAATKVLTDTTTTSMALYAGAKMEMWGAGLRYEMFDDADGFRTVVDNEHSIITATGWYNIDQNAVLKLEVSSTSADKTVFLDDTFAADDSMMAYGLGFLYRF